MYRIGVISDLHLDKRTEPGSWDVAEAAFRAAARADHVVVAGDTFDTGTAMRRDRGAVERLLRALGLWHPDRLTFVAGNHDIFDVGHRGDGSHRVLDALRTLRAKGQAGLSEFSEWIGELVPRQDRHFSNALFPYRRRLDGVTVVAADSTAAGPRRRTTESGLCSLAPEDFGSSRSTTRRKRPPERSPSPTGSRATSTASLPRTSSASRRSPTTSAWTLSWRATSTPRPGGAGAWGARPGYRSWGGAGGSRGRRPSGCWR